MEEQEQAATTAPVERIVLRRDAYYQMSTDTGYVKLEMPFRLSPEDAEDVIANLELIIGQIRRRSTDPRLDPERTVEDGHGSAWDIQCPECGNDSIVVVRPGKAQCSTCE